MKNSRYSVKSFVVLLLIVIFGIFLSCSKENYEGKTVLTFSFWGSPDMSAIEKEIIAQFENKYPNIKIKTIHIPSQVRYSDKLLTMIAGGTAPDVMFVHILAFPAYADSGKLLSLDDLIKRDIPKSLLRDIYPTALELFRYKGKIYGIPRDISSWVIFYNKKVFDEAKVSYPDESWTWKDFENACKRISRDTNGDGILDVYGAIFPQDLSLLFLSYGGKIFDDPENPKHCVVDQYKENLEALKFAKKLFDEKATVPLDVASGVGTYELFESGKVGMYFSGKWKVPDFKKIKNFEWDIAPIPKGKRRITRLSGSCLAISKDSKHIKEAWEFVKFYTGYEGVKISVKGGRMVPIYKSLVNSPLFLNDTPPEHIKFFADTMNYMEKAYFFPKSDEVHYILHEVLNKVVANQLSPEEGIKYLKIKLSKLVKEFQSGKKLQSKI